MNKASSRLSLAIRWLILLAALLFIYLPLIMVVVYSFSTSTSIGSGFNSVTFGHYANFFRNEDLLGALKNTLIIGLSSAAIATLLGTTAAVGIHYMKRRMKSAVDSASQITVVNAEIVTAMGFFLFIIFLRDTVMIPVKFSLAWLIIAHTVITTPYVILTVSPRLKQLNPNLLEASMDLGAGKMRSLFTVMLPQLAGAMVSGFALAFTLSLDDFVVTNINADNTGVETISTYVYDGFKRNFPAEIRVLSTLILVIVLVVLIGYNVAKAKKSNKQIKKG